MPPLLFLAVGMCGRKEGGCLSPISYRDWWPGSNEDYGY